MGGQEVSAPYARLGSLIAQEEVWCTLWRKVVMIFLMM